MIDTHAILIWLVLVAQSLIFGTAAFALMFPAAIDESSATFDSVLVLWRTLAILNLAMSPLVFIEIASGMAQTTWTQVLPLIPQIMRETLAGHFWMWRLVAALMLAIVIWIPARSTIVSRASMVLAAILIVLGSFTSHAIDKDVLVIAIYSIHQAAVGLWLGALVSLLMSARHGPDALEAMTPRVSKVCAWSVGVIVITGSLTAFQWLGWNLHLLVDSAYGRTLTWKIMVAAPALVLGAFNRYWQVPRVEQPGARGILIRTVSAECVILLVVLAWSAILANTPPPH